MFLKCQEKSLLYHNKKTSKQGKNDKKHGGNTNFKQKKFIIS